MPSSTTPWSTPATVRVVPQFEGANICTWIGFKHVNYLVEHAVLAHLREKGWGARRLFEEYGVGVELVTLSTRILTALHVDDEVRAEVVPVGDGGGSLGFKVTMFVERDATEKAVTSTVEVVLRSDDRDGGLTGNLPEPLRGAVTTGIGIPQEGVLVDPSALPVAGTASPDIPESLRFADRKGIAWVRTVPYFYCHHTARMQMTGYLRQMEEAVDVFLAEHSASIWTLLDESNLIPVVPRSRIDIVGEIGMEETLLTVFSVTDSFRDVTYDARMDCYAVRGDRAVLVATGTITHGYASIDSRADWSLVGFTERLLAATGAQAAS